MPGGSVAVARAKNVFEPVCSPESGEFFWRFHIRAAGSHASYSRSVFVGRVNNELTRSVIPLVIGPANAVNPAAEPLGGDTYSMEVPIVVVGECSIEGIILKFSESEVDVDSSGRFDNADPIALAGLVGSSDPLVISAWDIDRDGQITQEDVDLLQALIDAGLGSGMPGDINGDGVLDCQDNYDALIPGATVWSSGYAIEADLDLDGIVDQSEIDTVRCLRLANGPSSDVDGSDNIDLTDAQLISTFVTTGLGLGDADVNCDENVDLTDASQLAAAIVNGCD